MKLEVYAKTLEIENNILNNSIRILNTDATTVVDVANIEKSLEIGNIQRTDEFESAFVLKVTELSSSITTSSEDLLYLARSLQNVSSQCVTDIDCLDFHGNVTVGQRTLEGFGDIVLEEYYNTKEN